MDNKSINRPKIPAYILPGLSGRYIARLALVALARYLIFSYVLIPVRIQGGSMEPAYKDGGYNLIWRPAYTFSGPGRFDVVGVRLAGEKVMLLKRVIALEGEVVEFRKGKLFVNGREIDEPYMGYKYDWTLAPRKVEKGKVYVAGDNRNMPMKNHSFGQTPLKRIVGVPLW